MNAARADIILIYGPTASGKSALALDLAARISGTIINADSMQVYRELRVLTARPSAEEEALAAHRLYGHVPAQQAYSAGRFIKEAGDAIGEVLAAGRIAIVTGGTGLYFKALLGGLSPIPPIENEIREYWRNEAKRLGAAALYALLKERDPGMAARLRPSDPQRIVRALEVLDSSGRSLADWQAQPGTPIIEPERTLSLRVDRPREDLWARAEARFDRMVEQGALDEVRDLAALHLDPSLPAMRALGVRPLIELMAGKTSRAEAIEQAKAETRQFIKRQQTWASGHMITWKAIETQEIECIDRTIIPFIQC